MPELARPLILRSRAMRRAGPTAGNPNLQSAAPLVVELDLDPLPERAAAQRAILGVIEGKVC
jgi:hypothetical protein